MSFIRTVLGDIDAPKLGVCYAHEHIIIDHSYTTAQTPDFLLDSVPRAVEELVQFRTAGGSSMIDSMPIDGGRNVRKLAEISERSLVHIVCPTGLHLARYYPPGHWSETEAEGSLAERFIHEIDLGIEGTSHRAGLIKVATEKKWTDRENRIVAAAAVAHRATGSPILTHTEEGELGLEQVERFQSLGVDLHHVCLSHLDRKPDLRYHREILSSGVSVEYDSAFRWKRGERNPTLELMVGLIGDFPRQIMLGMDAARRKYWRSYGGAPGLTYLLDTFSVQLRAAGLTQDHLHRIFVDTPAATYSFARPRSV